MKKLLLPIVATMTLGSFNLAYADEGCGTTDPSTWMTEEAAMAKAEELGYTASKVKVEDGCYEVYATKDGNRFEVFLHPVTGDLVKVKDD